MSFRTCLMGPFFSLAVACLPEGRLDVDHDGHEDGADDCDATDPAVHSGASEICDARDNNCNGQVDELPECALNVDQDSDGYPPLDTQGAIVDCDDQDAQIHPGASELCDHADNDCDGESDEDFPPDNDLDGYRPCHGDCDDTAPSRFPGAPELCDREDTNCSGGQADYFVSSAAPSDGPAIQAVLAVAGEGCSIEVDAGTYRENLVLPGHDIHLFSRTGRDTTILDGGGEGPVILAQKGQTENTVIEGFTLTRGSGIPTGTTRASCGGGLHGVDGSLTLTNLFIYENVADFGGGVYFKNGTLILLDSHLEDNVSLDQGGGLYVEEGTQVRIERNLFFANYASISGIGWGGGMALVSNTGGRAADNTFMQNEAYAAAGVMLEDNQGLVLEGNSFQGNASEAGGAGIASFLGSDNSTISHNVFQENFAGMGVAIHLYTDVGRYQDQLISENDFDRNTGNTVGGAIYCGGCSATLTQNRFLSNQLLSPGGSGGAVFLDGAEVFIHNNLFTNNRAENGGAIYSDSASSASRIYNNTIAYNNATRGGSVYFVAYNPTLENNLMVFSSAQQELYGEPPLLGAETEYIRYNDLYSAEGAATSVSGIVGSNGNISLDPLFVNDSLSDYTLSQTSPAIDAGNPDARDNDIDGTRNDMGITGGPGGWVPSP